jgi:acetolactate synthase-1/2/3 large subunit
MTAVFERADSEARDSAPKSAAETFLFALKARGITEFFVNSGTDFAPLLEAYARLDKVDTALTPKPIVAAHENLAMGMAHGAYLMTGRPQAVMFHVNVGTANAVCGALNAAAERIPLLICAGRSPLREQGRLGARNTRVTWAQEMFDQAGLVREAVKWEYELRDPAQVGELVQRGLSLALSEPRGPVYLSLPREALAAPVGDSAGAENSPLISPGSPWPDPAAIDALADRLADARLPIISSLASGADPHSVEALVRLCEDFAIGFAEEQARYLNFPDGHALHLGHALTPILNDADVLCFVEADVPWMPEVAAPLPEAFIAQCGLDPNFSRYPMRSHRADLLIATSARVLFERLHQALAERKHRIDPDRHSRIAARAAAARERLAALADTEAARGGPISNLYLSAVLGSVLHDQCVLFSEYWGVRDRFRLERPGSYFYLPATGGLGWGLPAALGAKLAAPERTCIAAIGDGTYLFSNPAACHHASQKHDLPVLTVICNNARWNAVTSTARLVYPDGALAASQLPILSDLAPAPAYEHYAVASGGFGEAVAERSELLPALMRALHAVEVERRQAVLNVICA